MSETFGIPRLSEVFALFADYGEALGLRDLNKLQGLWEGQVGTFRLQLNAHEREVESVPPFTLAVHGTGGLPLGLVDPFGGALVAGVEGELIEALRAATAEAKARA